jgi:hypothetical protein
VGADSGATRTEDKADVGEKKKCSLEYLRGLYIQEGYTALLRR